MFLRSVFVLSLCWASSVAADSALVGLKRTEQTSPWKAIGRLDSSTGYCTATLIAPDLVLSAAHCTYEKNGKEILPTELTFRAGFNHGKVQAERRVVQIARPKAYEYKSKEWIKRIANDAVLLRLEKPIPTHIISPFIVEPRILDRGEVSVVSYGRGRENVPSLQQTCDVLQSYKGMMLMDCDTTFGSSGAPVFRREGSQIRITSVISGYVSLSGKRRTTGVELPALVRSLKAKMVAEKPAVRAQVKRIGVGTRTSGGAKFIRPGGS